jgi:hypothetical protein
VAIVKKIPQISVSFTRFVRRIPAPDLNIVHGDAAIQARR